MKIEDKQIQNASELEELRIQLRKTEELLCFLGAWTFYQLTKNKSDSEVLEMEGEMARLSTDFSNRPMGYMKKMDAILFQWSGDFQVKLTDWAWGWKKGHE